LLGYAFERVGNSRRRKGMKDRKSMKGPEGIKAFAHRTAATAEGLKRLPHSGSSRSSESGSLAIRFCFCTYPEGSMHPEPFMLFTCFMLFPFPAFQSQPTIDIRASAPNYS
jgi:hypothetical protein